MGLLLGLDVHQVPVFETFVVPRFLSMFGAIAFDMLLPCEGAIAANVGCRTGFPDHIIPRYLPGAVVVGFDPSEAAMELAKTKSALIPDVSFEYRTMDEPPVPVSDGAFSHALAIYPLLEPGRRSQLIGELARILAVGGQLLYAMPLRGSYQEVADLLREYALKYDAGEVAKSLEANITTRPTMESFPEEFHAWGLSEIDVDMRLMTLSFSSGRDFFEDPITRQLIIPDIELSLGMHDLVAPLEYVREAIDRYWSEGDFELSVNLGCVSARRL